MLPLHTPVLHGMEVTTFIALVLPVAKQISSALPRQLGGMAAITLGIHNTHAEEMTGANCDADIEGNKGFGNCWDFIDQGSSSGTCYRYDSDVKFEPLRLRMNETNFGNTLGRTPLLACNNVKSDTQRRSDPEIAESTLSHLVFKHPDASAEGEKIQLRP